jgi:hypothetical protein
MKQKNEGGSEVVFLVFFSFHYRCLLNGLNNAAKISSIYKLKV